MKYMVVCLLALALALSACAATRGGNQPSLPAEPWNGMKQNFRWTERVEISPSTDQPDLIVDLTIPVGRPGSYGFEAPCIAPTGRQSPCISRGLPPRQGDLPMAGMPWIHFEADTSLLGHVTL